MGGSARVPRTDWVGALRAYVGVVAVGNLAWETLHLPLYTIWRNGTVGEQAFAVVHCTGGDILIALTTLMAGLLVFGDRDWPGSRFMAVALAAMALGIAYTAFSEWLNVSVRKSWAYSDWMPVLPLAGGIGLSPLLQWLVVPSGAFWAVRLRARA